MGRPILPAGRVAAARGAAYRVRMLKVGDAAPDFPIGETTLQRILKEREVVVFFFPKAFTPG